MDVARPHIPPPSITTFNGLGCLVAESFAFKRSSNAGELADNFCLPSRIASSRTEFMVKS